jgi:hypothetical protein
MGHAHRSPLCPPAQRAGLWFPDDIVYLDRVGYWLADKPWPAASYRPHGRKRAA